MTAVIAEIELRYFRALFFRRKRCGDEQKAIYEQALNCPCIPGVLIL
jgi:hypothetical protein